MLFTVIILILMICDSIVEQLTALKTDLNSDLGFIMSRVLSFLKLSADLITVL